MKSERSARVWSAMLNMALASRESVLFGLASFAADEDLKDSTLAAMLNDQAEHLGITLEEKTRAIEAMKATQRLLEYDK